MTILENLNLSNNEELTFIESIYTDSFPRSERRPFNDMIDLYKESASTGFIILLIKKASKDVGFLTYWDMGEFIFAEHFAIISEARNGGIGAIVINQFMDNQTKPIILEVEIPTTILADRRIGFYQRVGFKLWNMSYQQPPYYEGENPIPMKLMTWGKIDLDKDFTHVKEKIYTVVYNY